MNKNENAAKINFACEAEKNEKDVMGVVNGDKDGIAAVVLGKCSREDAEFLCNRLAVLAKNYRKGNFSCVGDGKGRVRFDLFGDAGFVADALKEIGAKVNFGEDK